MARQKRTPNPKETAGILAEIIKNARLTWRLLRDGRISPWLKAIPFATLLYLLSPIDLAPDPILGLGQLDDIAIILLGIKLFIDLCPEEIVRQHLMEMTSVAGSYRVVTREEPAQERPGGYIEIPYVVKEEEDSNPGD
ncbi:MAG: YkvA family protein [Anaerolineae bacterium]